MNHPVHQSSLRIRSLVLAVLLLASAGMAAAQTASSSSTVPAVSATAVANATAPQPDATGHAIAEPQDAGGLLSASENQAEAERAAKSAVATPAASSSSTPETSLLASPVVPAAQAPPEKAKYDVTQIGHRNVGTGLNFYSLEREMAVGQDLAKQVEQSSRLVTDPAVIEYVNRIGQNLVHNSDSRVPFTIKVIDSGEINAFALPGGFFYVDSGLILAADSEAELAAIMSHEIAHVAARHATKNMTKQQLWNMASIPLMFVGGPAGYAIAEIASIAVPMSFLKFSRDSEREADMLGLQYDYAAGYDPQAFIQFFERLKAEEKQKHSKMAKLFSTHPMTADRITAAQNEINTYFPGRDSYVVNTSEFDAMKTRLLQLQGNRHLTVDQGGKRPVLRKHTEVAAGGANTDQTASPAQPQKPANDTPTLKRADSNPD